MKYQECPQCGDRLAWTAHYCSGCGTPFDEWSRHPSAAPARRGWSWPTSWRRAVPAPLFNDDTRTIEYADAPAAQRLGPRIARTTLQLALPVTGLVMAAQWAWTHFEIRPRSQVASAQTRTAARAEVPTSQPSPPAGALPAAPTPAAPMASSAAKAPASTTGLVPGPVPSQQVALAASTQASGATSATVPAEPATAQEVLAAGRAWFDAGKVADDAQAMRQFYAETVDYYARGRLPWAEIAADKTAYLARWPVRSYELLRAEVVSAPYGGMAQVALHFAWRVEREGRWRRGQAVTVLGLQRIGGQLRIVMERPG